MKKFTRVFCVLMLSVVMALSCFALTACPSSNDSNGGREETESESAFRRFVNVELGMTTDEVGSILGKKDEELGVYYGELDYSNVVSAVFDEETYGYINCTFWYYRGSEYEINEANTDFNYEYQPYYQIRVAFKEGRVIEAYFDFEFRYFAITDYCLNSNPKSIDYLDDNFDDDRVAEKRVRVIFDNYSVFLGTVSFISENGTQKIDAPWGEVVLDADGQPMQAE